MSQKCKSCNHFEGGGATMWGKCGWLANYIEDERIPLGTPEVGYRLARNDFGCIFYEKIPMFTHTSMGIKHVPTGQMVTTPGMTNAQKRTVCSWLNDLLDGWAEG